MLRFAIAASVFSAALVAGYGISRSGGGAGCTLPSGRSVAVSTDWGFRTILCSAIFPDTESVTLGTFNPRKVLVKPTSIEVDGKTVATIDESTKSVTVAEKGGRLLIAADELLSIYDAKF